MTHALMRTFHIDGVGLGNLTACYFYAYLVTQLFVGPFLDLYSPKYLTVLAIGLCAAGTLMFAETDHLYLAMLARALIGAGTAFATVSYMKMSTLWFRSEQVAFVDGLLATAAMAGALCGQLPLRVLVNHLDWRGALLVCGFFGVALMIGYFIFVREKKNSTEKVISERFVISGIIALLKSPSNWILMLYSGLAFTPVAVLGGLWGNPFFQEAYHLTPTDASSFSSLMFIGLAVGGPVFGYLSSFFKDKLSVMMVGTIIGLLGLVVIIYLNHISLYGFGLALFMFGFGLGSFMSCFALGKGMNPIGYAASVVALINSGDALFGSFTEPMIGKILDSHWTGQVVLGAHYFSVDAYHVALSILPFYALSAFICLFVLKCLSKRK